VRLCLRVLVYICLFRACAHVCVSAFACVCVCVCVYVCVCMCAFACVEVKSVLWTVGTIQIEHIWC